MSWKDAYRIRAGMLTSSIDKSNTEETKIQADISASKLAQAGFRQDIKDSSVGLKQPDKTSEAATNDALDSTIQKGGVEGFVASAAKVAETPAIKTILNGLSVGTYASANTANNVVDAVHNLKDGNMRGLSDLAMAPVTGIGQGINAGIGQDANDAKTYADVIKNAVGEPQNDAEKWAQGLTGFAGDVFLDPLTYATFGVTAAATGAARGAREGSKVVKQLAEDAIKKAPETAGVIKPKSTMTFEELAANPKGRIGTAIQEATKDHRSWKLARKQEKLDRKDIKARSNEQATTIDEFVGGPDVKAMEAQKVAANAAKTAEQKAAIETQLEAEVASAHSIPESAPNVNTILDEAKGDKAFEEFKPKLDAVKIESTPVKEPDTTLPTKFTEEVKAAVEAAPVALPKQLIDKTGEKISSLESAWVKPKYAKPQVVKELLSPGGETITKQVAASELARPEIAAKYGIDHTLYADPATHHTRVPMVETQRGANSTTGFTGRTAASKDKKKLQANTATGKKNARIKEENLDWSKAPKQRDDTPFMDDAGDNIVPETHNLDEHVDLDKLREFADANPNYKLMGEPSASGKVGMTLEKLIDLVGENSKVGDSVIENNLFFLARFAHDAETADPAILKDYEDAYKARMDEFMGANKAKDAPVETPAVDAPVDPLENTYLKPNMVDVTEANPNVWSPERAKQLGIKDEDNHLSPQEIAALTAPMSNQQIIRAITKTDNMSKGQMDLLRELTGKTTPEEIAKEFVVLRNAYKKEIKAAEKPAKVLRQTKEEEIARVTNPDEALRPIKATDENIQAVKADTTALADQFVASPVAFDEPYQMEMRRLSYVNALTDKTHGLDDETLVKIIDPETGRAGKLAINDFAHKATKDALAVQLKEAPHRTNSGMRTETTDITTGGAWSPKVWGSNSQQALHDSIVGAMLKQVENGAINKFNKTAKRKFYMSVLKVSDAELRAAGVEPFLNHIDDIPGKARTNVSLYDMFAALDDNGQALAVLDKHVFGLPSESFNITQIQGAFETMLRMRNAGKSEYAIRTRIKSQLTVSQAKHGRPVNNDTAAVNRTTTRLQMQLDHNKSLEPFDAKKAVRTAKHIDAANANKIADALLDPGVYRSLSYRQMVNAAAHNSSLGDFTAKYADAMVERLYKMADTTGPGASLKLFTSESRALRDTISAADYAKAKEALDLKLASFVSEAERMGIETSAKRIKLTDEIPPKPKPIDTTGKAIELYRPKGVPTPKHVDTPKGKVIYHVDSKGTVEAHAYRVQQAVNKTHVQDARAIEKEIADTPKPPDVEDFEIKAAEIAAATIKKMHPIQRLINPRLGMSSDVYRAVNSGLHSIARQQAHFHQSLSMHLEKYTAQNLRADFEQLQILARNRDGAFVLPEDASDSMRELYGIMNTMLEVSNANVFARNAVGVDHFNTLAKHARMPESWRFEPGLSTYENTHLWADKWEGIGEKGVLDFLSKMHSVAIKASQEIAIGASFSKEFGKAVPEAGYVKLTWPNQPKGNSSFYSLIDHDLYYPKEVASQVIQIDKVMRESRSLDTSKPFGKFMVNVFDPITNALKASQTTVRPGHWTVSIAGDLLRNQIAGVNSIRPYQHAVEIMKTAGLNPEDFMGKIDSAEALAKYRKSQEVSRGFEANSAGNGLHLFVGNKKVKVSYETMEKILHDVVILPKHRGGGGALEDRFVGENITNRLSRKLEKATDFVTDNKHFSLNSLAAKRDNFMRISLAVDYASKRKWNSLTEMKKGMEEYVTKWAPISTDMTGFESKYIRRTALYYTWLRGITPRIVDAAVTKPGVATMVPKGLYNMAYANGVNPESIGNPFPEDKLFPGYYYNNVLGPQWKDDFGMWGINPSSPVIEVADTFKNFTPGDPGGNALGALQMGLGMATPFVKMPVEMGIGSNSTGIPIKDNMQYVEDNLGGSYLSTLSRATGKTLNMDGIVNRTDSAYKGDPAAQAEHAKLQGINFLTGGKLTDYQSDGSIKSAQWEAQQKQKDQLAKQQRSQ